MSNPTIFPAIITMAREEKAIERLNACLKGINGPTVIWLNGISLSLGHCRHSLLIQGSQHNIGVTPAYHAVYESMTNVPGVNKEDWLLYLHDDTIVNDPDWYHKCIAWLRERPNCRVWGFGGAKGIGDPDIYQTPYKLQQLARRDFISNMTLAEVHGRRVEVPTKVAVLDLFALAVRMDFLRAIGGWSWWPHVHHGLDNAMCLEAIRHGHEVWMLPIDVNHLGGQTSTKVNFEQDFGESESKIHSDGHVTLYERYRDVLPVMVN